MRPARHVFVRVGVKGDWGGAVVGGGVVADLLACVGGMCVFAGLKQVRHIGCKDATVEASSCTEKVPYSRGAP